MVSVAGLILAACLCVPWAQSAAAPPSDVFSPLDYGQAFAAAIADDLVLLVYGTADWSSPCNRMEFSTWYMPEVVQALSGVALAIRVDVDEQPVLARNLGISVVPTIIAFRKGEEIDRRTGGLVPEHFLEWFDAVR